MRANAKGTKIDAGYRNATPNQQKIILKNRNAIKRKSFKTHFHFYDQTYISGISDIYQSNVISSLLIGISGISDIHLYYGSGRNF